MANARNSGLHAAHTVETTRRAVAERALAEALAREARARERVARAELALQEACAAQRAATPSTVATGLTVRRHGAHARARAEQVRERERELGQRKGEHAKALAAVDRARAELGLRAGKEQALERALNAEQALERRARERHEQDEQDELHAHQARGQGKSTH